MGNCPGRGAGEKRAQRRVGANPADDPDPGVRLCGNVMGRPGRVMADAANGMSDDLESRLGWRLRRHHPAFDGHETSLRLSIDGGG
jgi:hypothetical protein